MRQAVDSYTCATSLHTGTSTSDVTLLLDAVKWLVRVSAHAASPNPLPTLPCCFPGSVAMQLHDTIEQAESRAWNSQDSYTASGEHQVRRTNPSTPCCNNHHLW